MGAAGYQPTGGSSRCCSRGCRRCSICSRHAWCSGGPGWIPQDGHDGPGRCRPLLSGCPGWPGWCRAGGLPKPAVQPRPAQHSRHQAILPGRQHMRVRTRLATNLTPALHKMLYSKCAGSARCVSGAAACDHSAGNPHPQRTPSCSLDACQLRDQQLNDMHIAPPGSQDSQPHG